MGHQVRREDMVTRQLEARGITDRRVLDAMVTVPRHLFVPSRQRRMAYRDKPLPIGAGQTISQPLVVARMLEVLQVGPDDVVLDVGAGSGYAAAVVAQLAARVIAIERNPALAARAAQALRPWPNVEVVTGDGAEGWPEDAPFDAISVAAAAVSVPQPLLDQLAEGGRLVMPVGTSTSQDLLLLTRAGDELQSRDLGPVRFVPLTGPHGRNG